MSENNHGVSRHQQISLKDLIDAKEWQKIQDNFSAITEVGLRTLDARGLPFIPPSGLPKLCKEFLRVPHLRSKSLCECCLPTFLGGKAIVDKNLTFICDSGLYNFVAPLRVEGNALGYLILGPAVLVMRKPKEEYRKIAEKLGLDFEEFWSMILEIRVLSFHGARSLVELIKDVAEYTLKLAYENFMHKMHISIGLDSLKTNQLFNTLLDVAFEISGADVGSVMSCSNTDDELTIQASKGIPEEVVRDTRVKLGSGISGIAAKEGESFLIDENTSDNRIKSYLKRPYLGSSMVIPLKAQERVVGVMNLGALSTSSVRFGKDSLSLINKLAGLATLAIDN